MRRLVVPTLELDEGLVTLPEAASRHLTRVLRLGVGDRVVVLDGRGREAEGVLESTDGHRATVRLDPPREASGKGSPRLSLVQALPKGEKMDEIVRRATELGVAAIHPALAHRSVPRPGPQRATARVERWRRIAAEASRQCGRQLLPIVHELLPFEEALTEARGVGPAVVLWEGEQRRGLEELLHGAGGPVTVTLAIGPEGGLTRQEVERARELGFESASFGPLVLRAETAAIAACAVAQHLLGALGPRESQV